MHILLVEDDRELGQGLVSSLEQDHYVVDWVAGGEYVESFLNARRVDLMILDLGLPGVSGMQVLKTLRARTDATSATPVLIITAMDGVADRVAGLDAGADDYLVKPFALDELHARIRSVIRRHNAASSNLLRHGSMTLDLVTRHATVGDQNLDLSNRETEILELLMLSAGRPVSKDTIHSSLVSHDASLSENAIEVYVHRVRRKLEAAGVRVRTLRGIGYCLDRQRDTATS